MGLHPYQTNVHAYPSYQGAPTRQAVTSIRSSTPPGAFGGGWCLKRLLSSPYMCSRIDTCGANYSSAYWSGGDNSNPLKANWPAGYY
ncbi:hypothetical protein IAD21_03812 [Abditibacteriota bacterium]|nr:hypothetical protein IAD21_03812 [Abditibacteriota bacterium]